MYTTIVYVITLMYPETWFCDLIEKQLTNEFQKYVYLQIVRYSMAFIVGMHNIICTNILLANNGKFYIMYYTWN